jgi:hypothetical protein
MAKVKRDEVRENRIADEIIVDAYGEDEQAMGWYNHLEQKLKFPFTARCINRRSTSPLLAGNEVKVIGMAAYFGEVGHPSRSRSATVSAKSATLCGLG